MDSFLHELCDEVEVILQGVFLLPGTGDVSAVADHGFDNTACFLGSIDTEFHLEKDVKKRR
jgi:hypothetical protein